MTGCRAPSRDVFRDLRSLIESAIIEGPTRDALTETGMRHRSSLAPIFLLALWAAGPARAASSEITARAAFQKDLALLKRGGDTLARITIEDCYRKITPRSRVADVEACFMLDAINNRMDQAVRQNIGMTGDPTGFHNDADLLLRVSVPFARIGVEGSNAKALLADWSTAVSAALQ